MDFVSAWALGLSLGIATSLTAFLIAENVVGLQPSRRRHLFAFSALLAFGTAFPVGLTGLFFLLFGATGYCEESYPESCVPGWWVPLGLFLLAVVGGLFYLAVRGARGYLRTRRARRDIGT
jgi:hypothetical protein